MQPPAQSSNDGLDAIPPARFGSRQALKNLREVERHNRIEPHIGKDHLFMFVIEDYAARFFQRALWTGVYSEQRRHTSVVIDIPDADKGSLRLHVVDHSRLRCDNQLA